MTVADQDRRARKFEHITRKSSDLGPGLEPTRRVAAADPTVFRQGENRGKVRSSGFRAARLVLFLLPATVVFVVGCGSPKAASSVPSPEVEVASAEVLVGGEGHPNGLKAGYFVKPTVRIANDSKYGLHSAVLGTDIQRARRVASQLRAGRVVIDNMTDDPQAPWADSNTLVSAANMANTALRRSLSQRPSLSVRSRGTKRINRWWSVHE